MRTILHRIPVGGMDPAKQAAILGRICATVLFVYLAQTAVHAQRQTRTYVAFAIHNGLHPDGTWGSGTSGGSPNDADGKALRNCNANVSYGSGQCSSNGDCTLWTGQWAAYAISTAPFMGETDGVYVSAVSCGLSSQAAADDDALARCQSNGGGTTQCQVVWSTPGN